MSSLDGRAPLVIDVTDLQRRAGAMLTVQRTVPAPTDLANAMIAIPADSDIVLDLMAESVIEGVLISGTASAQAQGTCSRCLDPLSQPITVDVQELFRYEDLEPLTEEDEELPTFDGELIDIEPTLRDATVLGLPLAPVCQADCPGLCSICGAKLAEDPKHHHDQTDSRWDALAGMFNDERDSVRDEKD